MKGSYEVMVQNNRVHYRFTINRNITIIRGNSATGKTTLISLIAQYARNGAKSGVSLSCKKKCIVIDDEYWQQKISDSKDCLIFIDENAEFIQSTEFASLAKKSTNYYIIVTRVTLPNLPYSVDEIYELKNVTRGYGKIKRLYTQFQHIYSAKDQISGKIEPDCIIVEDSNSGYQFFSAIFKDTGIPCYAAGSNAKINELISRQPAHSRILIIADGAAFGAYIEKTLAQKRKRDIAVFLPESFEWLILKSGLIDGKETIEMLDNPSNYIESSLYFSWEQFFTKYLTEQTRDSYLRYQKSKLNPVYTQPHEKKAIIEALPDSVKDLL